MRRVIMPMCSAMAMLGVLGFAFALGGVKAELVAALIGIPVIGVTFGIVGGKYVL